MKKFTKRTLAIVCIVLTMVCVALVGCNPTVAVESVELNKPTLTLTVGQSETLTATVKPDDANDKTVTWKSSAADIAEVDDSGKVTAKAKGSATITVTTKDGEKTATCTVTVNEAQTSQKTALTDAMITVATEGTTFTGSALTPAVTVKDGDTTISADNYDVVYTNNTNAGTATVKVTAKASSTLISGSASKNFTIAQAEVTKDSFTVELATTAPEKSDKTVAQAPVVKYNNYTLKSDEYTVKYYYNGNTTTEIPTNGFTRQKKVTVKITIVKDKNFKFDGESLALDDKNYDIVSPTDAAFFTATSGNVEFNGADFSNNTNLAITKATTQNVDGVELYTITGTATPFADSTTENDKKDTIAAFNVNGVTERDAYIVLTFDNAENLYDIKMGWVDAPSDALVATSTTDTTASLGYKELKDNAKDHEVILWVTRPEYPRYFRVEMNSKVYVLDINGLTTPDFITVNKNKVYIGSDTSTSGKTGFQNSDNNLTITKEDNIYKISGKATAFVDANATEFDNKTNVNANHSYIVLKLNVKQSEKYTGGWVAAPGDKLVNNTSVGWKEHTIGQGDDDLVLWVTNPKASGLKYFRFEFGDRAYVLDITDLETGSNIFDNTDETVNAQGQKEDTEANGFKNKEDLEFKEEGNIIRVVGKSTKFTESNTVKFGGGVTTTDEYIVLELDLTDNETYKCGWVSDPNKALDSNGSSHSVGSSNSADKVLILCVTQKAGHSGWYYRFEINNESENKGLRAYVLDLSDLKKEGGNEYVFNFFKVDNAEENLGDNNKKFQNKTANEFTITKVEGARNVYKATGKATLFTDENRSAFNNTVTTSDAYIVMTLDTANNASVKMCWVKNVGDKIDTTDSNKDKTGYKEVTVQKERETFIIWTTRSEKTGNIFCVEIDGISYYLDCSELDVETAAKNS